jgi:hypothetical protein
MIRQPTPRDHLGLVYYRYAAAQLFWKRHWLTHSASVIWNLNLVNIIVLLVRHVLLALCSIALRPLRSAPSR